MTIKKTKQVDNAHTGLKAKIEIRQHVLDALGADRAVVFDAFAGPRRMWSHVWKQAAGYVGCDERWHRDARRCFVADNRRVMRCIDLAPFTCFDFDAYGSPWEQAVLLAVRRPLRPGERIGLVLTEGAHLGTLYNHIPPALRLAAGISRAPVVGASRFHEELITRALHGIVRRMGGRIARQWVAMGTTSAKMHYLGVVIER